MKVTRVDAAQLRTTAAKTSERWQQTDGLAGRDLSATSGAPSHERWFGPPVHAIRAEAVSQAAVFDRYASKERRP